MLICRRNVCPSNCRRRRDFQRTASAVVMELRSLSKLFLRRAIDLHTTHGGGEQLRSRKGGFATLLTTPAAARPLMKRPRSLAAQTGWLIKSREASFSFPLQL